MAIFVFVLLALFSPTLFIPGCALMLMGFGSIRADKPIGSILMGVVGFLLVVMSMN